LAKDALGIAGYEQDRPPWQNARVVGNPEIEPFGHHWRYIAVAPHESLSLIGFEVAVTLFSE